MSSNKKLYKMEIKEVEKMVGEKPKLMLTFTQ